MDYKFLIACEDKIESANLYVKPPGWRGFKKYPLKNSGGFTYIVDDTSTYAQDGNFQYCVSVRTNKDIYTYPGGVHIS